MTERAVPQAGGFARDLDILEALARAASDGRDGLRLTDVVVATGRDKSQLSRALSRLERAGLVTRDAASRRFVLGWRLFHLAAMTAEARLLAAARPAMRQIVTQLDESVHLCVLRGTSAVTVHSEMPRHSFRPSWIGIAAPAHTLTAGRVLLAEWSDAELTAAFPPELPDVPDTGLIRSRDQLLAECARIRRRGYAIVDEEFEVGLVGASAAVYDFRGIAVASLNIAGPKDHLARKLDSAGMFVARAATQLSATLGWLPGSTAQQLH